jgi:hypothetical protein
LVRAGHCEGAPAERSDIIDMDSPSPTPQLDSIDDAKLTLIRDSSGNVTGVNNIGSSHVNTGSPAPTHPTIDPSISSSSSSLASSPPFGIASVPAGLRVNVSSTTPAASPQVDNYVYAAFHSLVASSEMD